MTRPAMLSVAMSALTRPRAMTMCICAHVHTLLLRFELRLCGEITISSSPAPYTSGTSDTPVTPGTSDTSAAAVSSCAVPCHWRQMVTPLPAAQRLLVGGVAEGSGAAACVSCRVRCEVTWDELRLSLAEFCSERF